MKTLQWIGVFALIVAGSVIISSSTPSYRYDSGNVGGYVFGGFLAILGVLFAAKLIFFSKNTSATAAQSVALQSGLKKFEQVLGKFTTDRRYQIALVVIIIGGAALGAWNNYQENKSIKNLSPIQMGFTPLVKPTPTPCQGQDSDLVFNTNSYELSDLFAYNDQMDVYGIIENKSTTCAATDIVMAAQLVDSSKTVVEEQDLTLTADDGAGSAISALLGFKIEPQKTAGYKNTFQVYQALTEHDQYYTKGWIKPGITFQTHLISVKWVNPSAQ